MAIMLTLVVWFVLGVIAIGYMDWLEHRFGKKSQGITPFGCGSLPPVALWILCLDHIEYADAARDEKERTGPAGPQITQPHWHEAWDEVVREQNAYNRRVAAIHAASIQEQVAQPTRKLILARRRPVDRVRS